MVNDAKSTLTLASKRSRELSGTQFDGNLIGNENATAYSLRSEGQKPKQAKESKYKKMGHFNNRAFNNVPISLVKTLGSQKSSHSRENSERFDNDKKNKHDSKKSNMTIFSNNTLASNLSPESKISYSTLKSSVKSGNGTKSIRSGYSDKISKPAEKSSRNASKFPLNSHFLNKLRRKTKNSNNVSNYSKNNHNKNPKNHLGLKNSQVSKKSQNSPANQSQLSKRSDVGNVVQFTLNNNQGNTNVVQINNYINPQSPNYDRKSNKSSKTNKNNKTVKSYKSDKEKISKNSKKSKLLSKVHESRKNRYFRRMKDGGNGYDDVHLRDLVHGSRVKNLGSSKYKFR